MNIALIGFGYWGPNIAHQLMASHKFALVAICDTRNERIEAARQTWGTQISYTADYHEFLDNKNIDAIAVSVETESHYKLAREVLTAGKHLFIEKPLTREVNEATELKKLANDNGLVIHVDHIMVFHPIIRWIKHLIESGELGDLIYFDSSRMNLGRIRSDVSAMWDLAVHDLAVIDYLVEGQEPVEIQAMGEKRYSSQETLTYLTLRYPGFIAHLKSNWISPLKERRTIVTGTKKMVVFDDIKPVEKLMIFDKGIELGVEDDTREYKNYVARVRTGDLYIPYIPEEDALSNSLEHFARCIENSSPSITGPDQAIKIISILKQADMELNNSTRKNAYA